MNTQHRRRHRRALGTAVLGAAATATFVAGLAPGGVSHASPTPEPSVSPTGPTPGSTLPPPEEAPFDEPVGGRSLGLVDMPVYDQSAAPPPAAAAQAWIVADLGTGDVLAALNAHERRPPASTIKLLTVLAASPEVDEDGEYVATDADASIDGSRVGLAPGQTYSVDDIMHGLMLASGNDAAHALGELAGGQDDVVELMNDEAERLGAFDTHAVTPHGLDDPAQLSSAYDLALIGRGVLDDDALAELARTSAYTFPGLDGATFEIQNQNRLLDSYDGAIGLKTGYTTLAGHTLVAAAERDERRLVAVVLGAEGRAEDAAAALLDWAFATPDVSGVGRLVTPEEVAQAAENEDDAEAGGGPLEEYDDVLNGTSGTSGNVPSVVWISLAAALVAGALGFAFRSRGRRPRPTGRYASRQNPPR